MSIDLFSKFQKQFLLFRTTNISPQTKILLVIVTLLALLVPSASAACDSSGHRMAPNVFSAIPLPRVEEPISGDELSQELHRGKDPAMTGLWKTVFVANGAVVNLGFNTWHPDGTEWALDGGPPVSGSVCPGVWEKVGRRTYVTVHPAFNYDASNTHVVGIFIERLKVTIAQNGNRYEGTFTWDSYDLQGNLLSDASVAGTITGTRIQVDSDFPFPFPE